MHEAAYRWIEAHVGKLGPFDSVIEIGALNINGSVRPLFPGADYVGLDPQEGPGVDWVGDAVDYEPPQKVDCVVCTEVLEHAENWRELVKKGVEWLNEDGVFLITCAGPGRRPHSCVDGSYNLRDWEFYENVSPSQLAREIFPDFAENGAISIGFQARTFGEDTQAIAVRNG